ncbi:MAG: amidohydrolase family protein [Candidatus Marinimicrobia bacterium]|jgi:imidazolonepropionase-like amidohydrolase|nr:amidohydrolase family protein [Candidatus Neomarinimicrobiota bacterium]
MFIGATQPRAALDRVALVGATLINGTGGTPVTDATILIEDTKIIAVGRRSTIQIPDGVRIIDLTGKWVLPGFVDLHMHLTYTHDERLDALQTNSEATVRAVYYMNMFLRNGITSVRDVAAPIEPMQAIVRGIQNRSLNSIRVFPVGQLITTTGGHGAGLRAALQVNGPWEFRKAVRTMADAGFHHIKLSPFYTFEEVAAAVNEAKVLGMRVTSHGGGLADTWPVTTMTRIAVLAGVQCIEHLNQMDDDVLDLMAQRDVHLVPTLAIYRQLYHDNKIDPDLLERRHWTPTMHDSLFKKAHARHIVMGIGSDAVFDEMRLYPGLYFSEMKHFVELGMTPMEAISAATRNGAVILGEADRLGTIVPGKLADLQVVDQDPLQSFDGLGRPSLVMVGGKIHLFERSQ